LILIDLRTNFSRSNGISPIKLLGEGIISLEMANFKGSGGRLAVRR